MMNLDYFILSEVTVCFLSVLLCVNVFATFSCYERTHRLFLYSAISSALSTLFDVISVFCITNYTQWNVTTAYVINFLYFAFLIAVPFFISQYVYTLTYVKYKSRIFGYVLPSVLFTAYVLILILNFKTGWVFTFDNINGYKQGPLVKITYAFAVFLIVLTFFYGVLNKKYIAKRLFAVLSFYPIISLLILLVQFFYPKVLLSGLASFSAMLLLYITVQSDMLSVDFETDLFSNHQFQKQIVLKKNKGFVFVLSIENLDFIENHLLRIEYNNLLVKIGKKFRKIFGENVFHIAPNRFASIVESFDVVEKGSVQIQQFFENIYTYIDFELPVAMDWHQISMQLYEGEKNYNNIADVINSLIEKAKKNCSRDLLVCDDSILVDMEKQRTIFDVLKRELRLDSTQFKVFYQPIYSIQEDKLVYMEALARLECPEFGNVSPMEFIAVAERKGLIDKLGDVVLEKVCKFISENKNIVNAVSVNFSVYQISSPHIADKILKLIEKYKILPSNIIIEITESVFIENFAIINKNIEALTSAGVKFYLDDFGTGYSNLTNVVTLPFSTVKMDRSLVLMMEKNSRSCRLIKNLVSTFKDSNFSVLVEGVETENQNNLVKEAGVDYIQGYLYSRPIPKDECIKLLKKQN